MKKLIIGIVIFAVLAAGGMFVLVNQDTFFQAKEEPVPEAEQVIFNPLTGQEIDEALPARPLAFSIDNIGDAKPQSNLSHADIIYEFPVEGLQTRLQAVFYGDIPEFFGPCRSVRPYFVDMVREHGAIYVAHGWSGAAKRYLRKDVVPYYNAMEHGDDFYRVTDKESPHDSYIKWSTLKGIIDKNGWQDSDNVVRGFKFRTEDGQGASNGMARAIEAATNEVYANTGAGSQNLDNAKDATKINFHYAFADCTFNYDAETGEYGRMDYSSVYIDKETGKQITVKNILAQTGSSEVLDEKGRLAIDMCAGGDAYLFTDGKVIKGTWSRDDLDSSTIFVDDSGREFRLAPGKTWIEVMDQNCTLKY